MIDLRKAVVSALLVAAAGQAASKAAPQVDVIATGLNNPRGIAFSPDGRLYVAEAGRGGNGNCITTGDGQQACYGETGAITRIDTLGVSAPERVVTGLPSIAPAGGFGRADPSTSRFSAAATPRSSSASAPRRAPARHSARRATSWGACCR